MEVARRVQFVIFVASALMLGYLTFMSMMWGIWGAPVHPTHYIAALGAFALFAGAFVSLANPARGRIVSLAGLVGLGSLWIPGVVAMVPEHNVTVSPLAYLAFLLYFAATGLELLYPPRWKWSVPAFVMIVCVAAGFAGATAASRVRSGEFARPSFAYFRWHPVGESLVVEQDSDEWIDSEARALLARAGIRGRIEWTGSSGARSASHRVILLAQRQPASRYELRYPRGGVVIYAYDGMHWQMIPDNAATFSSFATIEPEKSATMLWQDAGGGRQGTTAFTW